MGEASNRSLNRAKSFRVLAALALAFSPVLFALAMLFHYVGSHSLAPS
jgi:hypothetical protein